MKKIWDVSRKLRAQLAPWPGDILFSLQTNARMAEGAPVNLGSLSMSLHNGTHADAPFHFSDAGETIENLPLPPYLGTAVVVDFTEKFRDGQGTITRTDLTALDEIPPPRRLLVKANRFSDDTTFPSWIPVLDGDAIAWLGQRQTILFGVDLPSVDPLDSTALENHHALHAAGIAIIESVNLSAVSPGIYQLAALPLPIVGGDGAPLRAILWREEE